VTEKEGPTNFLVTTTATSLHNENETRMLSLAADDKQGADHRRPEGDRECGEAIGR
jgi:hypothetical protein